MKKGYLFELNEELKVHNKTVSIKKRKIVKAVESRTASVEFYDDQQPIQLSGPRGFQYEMSVDWQVESFEEQPVTEDAEYTVQYSTAETNPGVYTTEQPQQAPVFLTNEPQPVTSYAQELPEELPVYIPEELPPAPSPPPSPALRHPDPLRALGEAVKGMSDDEFAADLAAILEGKQVFDPEKKELVDKNKVDDDFMTKLKQADDQRSGNNGNEQSKTKNEKDKENEDRHAIFDQIAQNMNFANSFDLGDFDMEQRFDSFDDGIPSGQLPTPTLPGFPDLPDSLKGGLPDPFKGGLPDPLQSIKNVLPFSTEDFVKDLDLINVESGAMEKLAQDPNWPSRPANLSPLTPDQKKQLFGMFAYEAAPTADNAEAIRVTDNWPSTNIQWVEIPQMKGKLTGNSGSGKPVAKTGMQFHTKGAKQLKALWAEWEKAGLLDRIHTFNGSYVPRYIRGTKPENRSDGRLSNHSWGTAFDINAEWNARGSVPALKGVKGCVRDLVEIANKHGFFWGGHFKGSSIDGMHFELVKIIP